jgi:hypothetical protein
MASEIKTVPLRTLFYYNINHIKIKNKMFIIGTDKEFYGEYGAPLQYNYFLNTLKDGIKDLKVFNNSTIEKNIYQIVQGNQMILRDNSDFKYQVYKMTAAQYVHLREAAKIYGLDYEVEVELDLDKTLPKIESSLISERVPVDDTDLNEVLQNPYGNHFKIDVYKNASIIKGKIVPNE